MAMKLIPYTGPTIPTAYDSNWQMFNNLTKAQVQWFQSQMQWLIYYAKQRTQNAVLTGTNITISGKTIPLRSDRDSVQIAMSMRQAIDEGLISSASFFDGNEKPQTLDAASYKAAHKALVGFISAITNLGVSLVNDINAGTVTSMAQIDAAIAAIAPNSPSAKGNG